MLVSINSLVYLPLLLVSFLYTHTKKLTSNKSVNNILKLFRTYKVSLTYLFIKYLRSSFIAFYYAIARFAILLNKRLFLNTRK